MCDHLTRSGGVLDIPRGSIGCLDNIPSSKPTQYDTYGHRKYRTARRTAPSRDLRVKKEFITYERELISKCRKSACPRASYGSEKNSPMWARVAGLALGRSMISISKMVRAEIELKTGDRISIR